MLIGNCGKPVTPKIKLTLFRLQCKFTSTCNS